LEWLQSAGRTLPPKPGEDGFRAYSVIPNTRSFASKSLIIKAILTATCGGAIYFRLSRARKKARERSCQELELGFSQVSKSRPAAPCWRSWKIGQQKYRKMVNRLPQDFRLFEE
jgi:hypothetical protein